MILDDNELLVIGASGHSAQFFFDRLIKENFQKKIKCLIRIDSQINHLKKSFAEHILYLLYLVSILIVLLGKLHESATVRLHLITSSAINATIHVHILVLALVISHTNKFLLVL